MRVALTVETECTSCAGSGVVAYEELMPGEVWKTGKNRMITRTKICSCVKPEEMTLAKAARGY